MHRKRQKVLEEVRAKLTGPQRPPVRIRHPFRSVSPVGVGDIFSFTLPSGKVVWMRCLAVRGDPQDDAPVVEILDWDRPSCRPTPPGGLRGRRSRMSRTGSGLSATRASPTLPSASASPRRAHRFLDRRSRARWRRGPSSKRASLARSGAERVPRPV
jgi:hypothetical protein